MHPDLFLRVYQQAERELTQRLGYRLAAQRRVPAGRPRGHRHAHVRLHR